MTRQRSDDLRLNPIRFGSVTKRAHRHSWIAPMPELGDEAGPPVCRVCLATQDVTATKRGRSSRRLGNDQERRAEKVYGWRKVGEFLGPDDLRGQFAIVQQKASRREPPKAWRQIFAALETRAMGRVPLILYSFVKNGVGTEDYIVLRGRDWLALHGKDEADD